MATSLGQRIEQAVDLVREVSSQTDPQEMVRRYRDRVRELLPNDLTLSLSRRDLDSPQYRITRSTLWEDDINPWEDADRIPLLDGGLLAKLIYGNEPRIINDLRMDSGDPAAEHVDGMRSLMALPLFDHGESLNMVVALMRKPNAFDLADVPDRLITANLFGRATHNLVLAKQLRRAFDALDAEFKAIAEIQRSLLPPDLPSANGLDLAAHYDTAHRAGGDYYDLFQLDGGRSAIIIADVSGHGAAAAVVMARLHAALHASTAPMDQPADVLEFANEQLLMQCRVISTAVTFVTAFYAVYNPADRSLVYGSAGHNPPRWRTSCGAVCSIAGARELPLGIQCGITFAQERFRLDHGDEILLFTDGIVEASNASGDQFGVDRLDAVLDRPHDTSACIISDVLEAVHRFTEDTPALDDRTMVALRAT